MKASELKEGHVLVDPEGHLYEVVGVIRNLPDAIHAWLWPDSSTVPNYFQTFEPDEEIVAVDSTPKPESATEETVVIPFFEEGDNDDTDEPGK